MNFLQFDVSNTIIKNKLKNDRYSHRYRITIKYFSFYYKNCIKIVLFSYYALWKIAFVNIYMKLVLSAIIF